MKLRNGTKAMAGAALLALVGTIAAYETQAFRAPELTPEQQHDLKQNFSLSVSKLKGPYTENICVCPGGSKKPIRGPSGALGAGCQKPIFCAAYRAPWAEALAKQRLYLGNIFSRDVYEWGSYPDHNDLVRGYILEKYFTETNPQHKLSQLRAFRGLASAEEVAPAQEKFFELYEAAPEFDPAQHFLLAYELQKRFFLRSDVAQVQQLRAAATRVEGMDPRFKPLKDSIHNQLSAGLLPGLAAYRDKLPQGTERTEIQGLIDQIQKLTEIDEKAVAPDLASIEDQGLRTKLQALVPAPDADSVEAISSLGQLMVEARQAFESKKVSPGDARKLIDLEILTANVLQKRGNAILELGKGLTVKQQLQLLTALTNATYGVGLLNDREREAALATLQQLQANPNPPRDQFKARLAQAERVVEWAQANATLPFAEVWAPWTYVLPQVAGIGDDILRGSPLLLYAQVARKVDDYASGNQRVQHEFFGKALDTDVRALNAGLVLGRLRVNPKDGAYTRDEIVALPDTPADLEPAAGILTRGEGNVLSHVQLLARALGIPNVVLGPSAYELVKPYDGKQVFFIATPGGRVIIKEASAMTDQDRLVLEEYTRNDQRTGDGSLEVTGAKLHIDKAKIDLGPKLPIPLTQVRRKDSGRMCGPKAAYLGELKSIFPDHVSRGIVVPFGAYYDHYQRAPVVIPDKLRGQNIATAGEPLPKFVERTYAEFFGKMIPEKRSDKELTAWIAPRLDIMRYSIEAAPLSPELTEGIKNGLDHAGLLLPENKTQTVGCFVRSDTNVEDLENFNGAGLNLTVFNRKSLKDIGESLKEVWASPFELRSFSWRQTLIDEPLWVLPSVVILESVPDDKSGVLVTGDIYEGKPGLMTIATSEGVGGAVDGTSAETLLWSPDGIQIITLFKSPWRNKLLPGGGSAVVPASGSATVLEREEIEQLVAAGKTISEKLEPTRDAAGGPRPWDIEFGFQKGKLWLFQCRPFIGNDSLKNVPALASLEGKSAAASSSTLSLSEVLK